MTQDNQIIKMTETVQVAKFNGEYDETKTPVEIVEVVSEIEMQGGVEISRRVVRKEVKTNAAD